MYRLPSDPIRRCLAAVLLLLLIASTPAAHAQYQPRFDQPALDAMLAPVALYPDPLLSQVLMAATYPREVEDAARWLRERPGLSGEAAVRSSQGWDWDPSVRSLLAFPQVLQTLADYPRWTQDLGDAFLGQREDVMETIQHLRRRAVAQGTLRSNEWIRVLDNGYAIVIEQASPQTVHVPYYDARVAYGEWWWPARPPMYWTRWPDYRPHPGRDPYVSWGPGIYLGSGFFFGAFHWPQREVRVTQVRPYYYPQTVVIERQVVPGYGVMERRPPPPQVWRPDPHRRGGDDRRRDDRRDDDYRRDARFGDGQRPATTVAPRPPEHRSPPGGTDSRNDRRGPDRSPEMNPGFVRAAPPQRPPEPATMVAPGATRPENREMRSDRPPRDENRGPRPDNAGADRRPPPQPQPQQARPQPQPQAAPPMQDSGDERRPVRRYREPRD